MSRAPRTAAGAAGPLPGDPAAVARARRALWALIALGAVARLLAFARRPALHPDEFFQYLEPAWHHLHGYGWPAWEWAVGLRSWVLPGYHGGFIAALGALGLDGGHALHFLQLHWAALTLLSIPLCFRIGGLWAGVLAALWPELVDFAPHALTEVPATILSTAGYAAWIRARGLEGLEERRALRWAGVWLSLSVCLRLPYGPLALVPAVDLLLRRRGRGLLWLALAAVPPLLAFGAVDWLTWGRPFHSALAFLDYNFIQGRAAEHGRSPWFGYLVELGSLTSMTLLILLGAALARLRQTWPALLPALVLVLVLTTQAHKEERFLLAIWPLLAMAWGLAMQGRRAWVAFALTMAILTGTLVGVSRRPPLDYFGRAGLHEAQAWVGRRPDVTGLLVQGGFVLSAGFAVFARNLPLETFQPAYLQNPIFNYAAVPDRSPEELWCRRAGMRRVWERRGWSVWWRST